MVRKRIAATLILLAVAIAVLVGAAASVPQIHWRVRILAMKLGGEFSEIEWSELLRMLRPGSPIYLESLVDTRNPYLSIVNPHTSNADMQAGEALFRIRCTACHSTAGSDETKVDFSRGTFRHGDSDWALYRAIGRGIPGTKMEGHADLSDEKLWQLVAFLRSLATGDSGNRTDEAPASAISSSPVTPTRLLGADAEPQNWLMYSGTYDGHRHGRLNQINRENVSRLRTKWVHQMSTIERTVEASPLVVDGVMYVVEPPNTVLALDASNGAELWNYERVLPAQMRLCCGRVNRGVALLENRVFVATLDAHLVALDAHTGSLLWDTAMADNESGYSATAAPLAVGDKIVVGISGAEFGIRGFLDAYDAESGERAWRLYTIPEPGEPGSESWEGDSWRTGGGSTWVTGSYDPDLGLVYWGVGNPWPDFQGTDREGDNLDTSSVIAVDPATGTLKWRFQFIPHDVWDYGAAVVPVLVDRVIRGESRKLLAMALKNGFAYLLDRETGEFLRATEIARQTWAKGIDEKGRPIRNEAAEPSLRGSLVYPSAGGGGNWLPPSFNPATGLLYIPVYNRGQIFTVGSANVRNEDTTLTMGSHSINFSSDPGYSALRALNVSTGEVQWEVRNQTGRIGAHGGTMTTDGGLVFWSDATDVLAIDAETGQILWRFNTGGIIRSAPTTFTVNGEQRIAIAAGRAIFSFGLGEVGAAD